MSVNKIDREIKEGEQRLRKLHEQRVMALTLEEAAIEEVRNDFFVKALPQIFKAYAQKNMNEWIPKQFQVIDKKIEGLKDRVTVEARALVKRGKERQSAIRVSDFKSAYDAVVEDKPFNVEQPQVDVGLLLQKVFEADHKLDRQCLLLKHVVKNGAQSFVDEVPGLITNVLDRMTYDKSFRRFILGTPKVEKARALDRLIKEVTGEPDADLTEKVQIKSAKEIFQKYLKQYVR